MEGEWSDGTQTWGEVGRLRAFVRGGKAFLRFCTATDDKGKRNACPNFGEEDGYVVRTASGLDWFRKMGNRFERYLSLTPASDSKTSTAKEESCSEEE